jgi:hypothetical protein
LDGDLDSFNLERFRVDKHYLAGLREARNGKQPYGLAARPFDNGGIEGRLGTHKKHVWACFQYKGVGVLKRVTPYSDELAELAKH